MAKRQRNHEVVARCEDRGVALKWFGDAEPVGYTSRYDRWHYIQSKPSLPRTERDLTTLHDMSTPLTFSESDCALVADIIVEVVLEF